MANVQRTIGLDLGTSAIRVAAWTGNSPEIIAPDPFDVSEPAVLAYTEAGSIVHGVEARRLGLTNPSGAVVSIKRLLGTRPGDAVLAALASTSPVRMHPGAEGEIVLAAHSQRHTAVEAVAELLKATRVRAEQSLRCEVRAAVMTVPVWFGDPERRALVDAAELAGLEAPALVTDPTAIALALVDAPREDRLFVIVDLGASGLSASILRLTDGLLECLASAGEVDVGGDELDRRLVALLVHELEGAHPGALEGSASALLRLREAGAAARIALDQDARTVLRLPYVAWERAEPITLEREITREELGEVARDLSERIAERCNQVLRDTRIAPSEIDQVIVTGGASATPVLLAGVHRAFAPAPLLRLRREDLPALGAATYSAFGARQIGEPVVLDVLSRSLRLSSGAGRTQTLVPRGTPLPARTTRIFATQRDDQRELALDAYDGDGELTIEGRHFARFLATGLPEGRAGTVQIEVAFLVGADGLVQVDARDLRRGDRIKVERRSPLAPLAAADLARLRQATEDDQQPTEIEVAINGEGVHNLYAGAIGGVRGVFVATESFPSLGAPLRLRLWLGDAPEPLVCDARVSFVRQPSATEPSGVGCQFVSLKAAARRAVEAFALEREPLLCD